jgi:hypothetical protein
MTFETNDGSCAAFEALGLLAQYEDPAEVRSRISEYKDIVELNRKLQN